MTAVSQYQWLASMGVGGILAGAMFFFYRKDFMIERRHNGEREKNLIRLIEESTKAQVESAKTNEKLSEAIERLSNTVGRCAAFKGED